VVHGYVADPGAASPGAAFASGLLATGTVVVPATSPALLAVGAVASRLRWPTPSGTTVYTAGGGFGELGVDAVAGFSSVGPNRVNEPRPDVLAPGAFVVAAMSAQATPSVATSIFRDGSGGSTSISVADDGVHAAGAGTSAAAPHVAGALALLLEAYPRATQDDLRGAIAGSARGTAGGGVRWNPAEAWGELAVDRALATLDAAGVPGAVDAAR
jgi:subtilisin family serine protease